MDAMRTEYAMSPSQMSDWRRICSAYAKNNDLKLVFVNESSFGVETKDGAFRHIYIDELIDILNNQGGM